MDAFRSRFFIPFVRVVAIAMMASVGLPGLGTPSGGLAAASPEADEVPVLAYTSWRLASMQTGPDSATEPEAGATFALVFGEGDAVMVSTDCATAAGTVAVRANHDVVPNLKVSGDGTCEHRSLPERFLNNLNLASSWVFDDGVLVLNLAADGGFIRLEQVLAGPTWRWTGFQGGDGATVAPGNDDATLLFHEDGMVTVSTGCATGTLPYTLEGQSGLAINVSGLDASGCASGSPAARLTQDLGSMRSFVFRDGELFVSLMADGGIHAFAASAPAS